MNDELKKGDRVSWNSRRGEIHGNVEKKFTEPAQIKGHRVAASKEEPQYLVKSDKTGAEAAHKAKSLKKQ